MGVDEAEPDSVIFGRKNAVNFCERILGQGHVVGYFKRHEIKVYLFYFDDA